MGREEVARYGVEVVAATVAGVTQIGGHLGGEADLTFRVDVADGPSVDARRLLVTTGVTDAVPDIPGVCERWGRDLLHCPYCHGWEVRDEPLGVLGTIPGSVEHALLVRQWSADVAFFSHTYELDEVERRQLAARDITVVAGEVVRLVVDDDRLTGVELADGRVVARRAVFVRPGIHPHPTACSPASAARTTTRAS